jgi:hypothetical protein
MTMNIAWKIGVKSQASRLTGSAPGEAGVSGGWGVGEAPPAPGAPGTQAATTGMIAKNRRPGSIRRTAGQDITRARPS